MNRERRIVFIERKCLELRQLEKEGKKIPSLSIELFNIGNNLESRLSIDYRFDQCSLSIDVNDENMYDTYCVEFESLNDKTLDRVNRLLFNVISSLNNDEFEYFNG
jgi:hypothetical protein